jgi:hypothetical protein
MMLPLGVLCVDMMMRKQSGSTIEHCGDHPGGSQTPLIGPTSSKTSLSLWISSSGWKTPK